MYSSESTSHLWNVSQFTSIQNRIFSWNSEQEHWHRQCEWLNGTRKISPHTSDVPPEWSGLSNVCHCNCHNRSRFQIKYIIHSSLGDIVCASGVECKFWSKAVGSSAIYLICLICAIQRHYTCFIVRIFEPTVHDIMFDKHNFQMPTKHNYVRLVHKICQSNSIK